MPAREGSARLGRAMMHDASVPSGDIPQADSLDKIRAIVAAVARGARTTATLSEEGGLSERHVAYHVQAARVLGWLKESADGPSLTATGRSLLQTEPQTRAEAEFIANSVAANASVVAVAPSLLDDRGPTVEELEQSIESQTGLSASTSRRRARTLLAWRERIRRALYALTLFEPKPHVIRKRKTKAPLKRKAETASQEEVGADAPSVIKSIDFGDWKSFRDATLHIDPLTVLIGTNSGGKSNALDGLEFLHRTAMGEDLSAALGGTPQSPAIRGGIEWATRQGASRFRLGVVVQGEEPRTEYHYTVTVETTPRLQLSGERLTRVRYRPRTKAEPNRIVLFETISGDGPSIVARFYNGKSGTRRDMLRSASILSQVSVASLRGEIADGIRCVLQSLKSVFILDPVPSRMRGYTPFSETLLADASNLAGVLAALPKERKKQVESVLSDYLRRLPERDIRRVYTEPVGKFGKDAMLYCEEQWTSGRRTTAIDARGMSDGVLRFVAILTALLTRPAGSLLVIEEVDNGLHPSRSGLLLEVLKGIGARKRVDVLVTTHNQALLDALGPEMVPFVVFAHRNPTDGCSELTLLEDLSVLPKLIAAGPLGQVVTRGLLEQHATSATSDP